MNEKIKSLINKAKLLWLSFVEWLKKDSNWQKVAIGVLAVITITAVIITIVTLSASAKPVIAPEFAPQETDDNAQALVSESDTDKMEHEEGGGAVSLTYSNEVTVYLDSNEIKLLFQNPSRSTQDIVLQLIVVSGDTEVVIAQSEKLPPGYMLQKMELLDTATLSAGTYTGRFNALYYNPETGERAIVNTNIPVTITVK